MTTGDSNTNSRYIYYYSTNFYRYDTWTDQWMQLQSPPVTPATTCTMRFSSFGGFRGRVLSGTTNTILGAALRGNIFSGVFCDEKGNPYDNIKTGAYYVLRKNGFDDQNWENH